jgi:hypothetical protein
MSYAPGTLFRIYSNNNSKHYTAVLLKDGQVLEIKNPDTGKRETFPGLSMWRASHGAAEDEVHIDSSKGVGVVMDSDTNGYNYLTEKHPAYKWIQWCYSIIKEVAPQLLSSEEFRAAYNNMAEICTKHKQELTDWRSYSSGVNRYNPDNVLLVAKNQYRGEMNGFPGRFQYQYYSYSPYTGPGHKRYSKDDYDKASTEISAAYVAVVNLIKPQIEDYMSKKHKMFVAQNKISQSKAAVKRYLKKIDQLQSSIKWYETYVKRETDNIDKLEMEFVIAKAAAM